MKTCKNACCKNDEILQIGGKMLFTIKFILIHVTWAHHTKQIRKDRGKCEEKNKINSNNFITRDKF